MINRELYTQIKSLLKQFPAVALLGPRQVGKTTLALMIAKQQPSVYLDLESSADRNKLTDPLLYLSGHEDKLVIIDEVQQAPELFQSLRGIIDQGKRKGLKAGRFLLLGSSSIELLQQSGESLAGRIAYVELSPLNLLEVGKREQEKLWLRGGFPDSFLADSDQHSLIWRENFIRTYLERDIPNLGPRIPAETLRRFWMMLAHHQGGVLNAASLARSLAVDGKTISRYLDLLVDLLLVKRLMPWQKNQGKRLVKSPKVYVSDSGIVHALLDIVDREQLLAHPIVGASWEGFVIETLIRVAHARVNPYFYRTAVGAEIDLLLEFPSGELWAIEIKRSLTPKVRRGFHHACADLQPKRQIMLYAGTERYPLTKSIEVMSVFELATEIYNQGD